MPYNNEKGCPDRNTNHKKNPEKKISRYSSGSLIYMFAFFSWNVFKENWSTENWSNPIMPCGILYWPFSCSLPPFSFSPSRKHGNSLRALPVMGTSQCKGVNEIRHQATSKSRKFSDPILRHLISSSDCRFKLHEQTPWGLVVWSAFGVTREGVAGVWDDLVETVIPPLSPC